MAGCEYIRCSVIEPRQVNTQSSHDTHDPTHANAHPSFTTSIWHHGQGRNMASADFALVRHLGDSQFKARQTAARMSIPKDMISITHMHRPWNSPRIKVKRHRGEFTPSQA